MRAIRVVKPMIINALVSKVRPEARWSYYSQDCVTRSCMYQCGEIPPGMYLVPEPGHGCWKEVYLNMRNSMVIKLYDY